MLIRASTLVLLIVSAYAQFPQGIPAMAGQPFMPAAIPGQQGIPAGVPGQQIQPGVQPAQPGVQPIQPASQPVVSQPLHNPAPVAAQNANGGNTSTIAFSGAERTGSQWSMYVAVSAAVVLFYRN